MKILMISNMIPSEAFPSYGVFVKNCAEMLRTHGCRVDLVGIPKQQNRFLKSVAYLIFTLKVLSRLYFKQYDIVYAHYILHTLIPLRLFTGKQRFKLVLNAHGGDVLDFSQHAVYRFVRPVYFKADLIVVPSAYYQGIIQQREREIAAHRVFVSASGGVDTNYFTEAKPELISLNLLFVSRIISSKGWRTYIAALDILHENGIAFQSRIVGDGPDFASLKKELSQRKWAPQNECLGGLNQLRIKDSYQWCSAFVFPTERRAESLGLVGLEAMSCGRVVIGSDLGGLRDYIRSGKNGFFFTAGDARCLAGTIMDYWNASQLTKIEMSNQARQTALMFDKEIVSRALAEKLKNLVS